MKVFGQVSAAVLSTATASFGLKAERGHGADLAVGARIKIFEPLVKGVDLRQFRVVRKSVQHENRLGADFRPRRSQMRWRSFPASHGDFG
jgi:hypothetical protein